MKREKFEFDGFPFYFERVNNHALILIYNTAGEAIGTLDTSTSKQDMTPENLELILSDRIYEIQRQLKNSGVKL